MSAFIAAVLPGHDELYTSYITRMRTSPITNETAIQASSDSGGTYEKVGDGEYLYTFGARAPSNFDSGATHTIGVYARRDLTEFELGRPSDDDTFNFVPDGSEVTEVREIVSTAACNSCHMRLTVHGRRHSVELCIMCHQPQSRATVRKVWGRRCRAPAGGLAWPISLPPSGGTDRICCNRCVDKESIGRFFRIATYGT